MNCPSCNTECIEGSNYCHHCGFFLKPYTGSGSHIPAYNIFSQNNTSITHALKRLMPASYVEKLLASDGRTEGERRVVTILFSDVKGSTAMGESLDPEELLNIMNNAFGVLIEPIMRYEGTLARLMGDAILAFFGAPIAHEDDPIRACKAALEIMEGINKFRRNLEKEKGIKGFSVRVGINTGLVVVAEVGADLRVEYTAMGDAVNVAARMETSAEPGTILITEDTKKLIGNKFELLPMGPIQVKGRTAPVNTYRVLSEAHFSDMILNDNTGSPFLGRTSEMEKLTDALNVQKNKGKIVAVIGECGIGKTRLISEFSRLTGNDVTWKGAQALAYQQNSSYWLIRNIIKTDLLKESRSSGEDLSSCLLRKLQKSRNSSYVYTFLSHLLEIYPEDSLPLSYELGDAQTLKGQIHYSVKEYFRTSAAGRKMVLLFEDLQWSDSASLDLITDLFSLAEESQVIIILTFRKNEGEIWNIYNNYILNLYKNQSTTLSLEPLDKENSRELLNSISGDIKLNESVKGEILKRMEGNPFFIEETVKSLQEKEHFNKPGVVAVPAGTLGVTTNLLQGVIMSRLDYLSPADKMVLQSASVFGRAFSKAVLKSINSESLSSQQTEDSLEQLLKKDFIICRQDDQDELLFRHNIIQEVAYSSLLRSTREKIHLNIAEAIEKISPENFPVETLAHHFEKGNSLKKAARYYFNASGKAKEMFANRQALDFYGRIVNISGSVQLEKEFLIDVYESCADVHCLIAEYQEAFHNYEKCLETTVSEIAKGRIYQKCGQMFEYWGQYKKAIGYYDMSEQLLRSTKEVSLLAGSYIGKGMAYFREGMVQEAMFFTQQALGLVQGSDHKSIISKCFNNLGIIHLKNSEFDMAENYLHKALIIRMESGSTSGLAATYNNLGFLYQQMDKLQEAAEYYKHSLEYCEKTGNIHALAKIYDNLSNLYISENEIEKANEYNLLAMEILGKISLKDNNLNQHVWLQAGVW